MLAQRSSCPACGSDNTSLLEHVICENATDLTGELASTADFCISHNVCEDCNASFYIRSVIECRPISHTVLDKKEAQQYQVK